MKGIANHHGPESCLDLQQWGGEALTGEHTGRPLNSEITSIRRLTLFNEGESNIGRTDQGEVRTARRSQRTQACVDRRLQSEGFGTLIRCQKISS
ncbi:hypothetical protein [Chlorobium limicola]|uniref:hypothetical protein n=1 Tax=Chlorobium limicola TaxID=1092 RepID=UPI001F353395|nr:hypothetical protein [Chlorobium limicola]